MHGRVALVTGASRGVGRGVAIALHDAGARVYATGRTVESADLPQGVIRLACDHMNDLETAAAFAKVEADGARLDVLVNSAWAGYERMVEDGRFTWGEPFFAQPAWRWDAMLGAGVRAAFIASGHAARLMLPARRGLIVNVSSWAARKYLGNAIYGVAKAATDRLTAECSHELAQYGICVVSLYPGLVRTEAVLAAGAFDLSNSESPEFSGRAVAALALDPDVMRWTGRVTVAAELAREYGFSDVDGRLPRPLRLEDA
jgi:NAD(P)-dependent dehydrogenase (short-subunit alcohol dehydrogenase family)